MGGNKLNLIGLPLNVFRNNNNKKVLKQRLNKALRVVNRDNYRHARRVIENGILETMDGCALRGTPDLSPSSDIDMIKTCEAQAKVYPLIREAADLLQDFY